MNPPVLTGLSAQDATNSLIQYIANLAGVAFDKVGISADQIIAQSNSDVPSTHNLIWGKDVSQYHTVNNPGVTLPAAPTPSNFNVDFAGSLNTVKTFVDGVRGSWMMQYFPASMPNGFDPLMQQILGGAIVTQSMQDLLWGRAKSQVLRENLRAQDELANFWNARGFSLPPGVMASQLAKQNQEYFNASVNLAAQQAIKALDLQVDASKFAAEVGTKLQLGLIEGLTQLISAYSRLPAAAAEYASAMANAQRSMYLAIAEYYRTVIQSAEISLKTDMANSQNDLRYAEIAAQFIGTAVGHQVQAAATKVDTYARGAASALSGLNTVASTTVAASV